mmetsp:Transcript_7782/g.23133  ORF Transcript_7782/g.23133 Transcript_7782/m.23133 type:complete len:186 (-) Transcript_7782:57-614(-)
MRSAPWRPGPWICRGLKHSSPPSSMASGRGMSVASTAVKEPREPRLENEDDEHVDEFEGRRSASESLLDALHRERKRRPGDMDRKRRLIEGFRLPASGLSERLAVAGTFWRAGSQETGSRADMLDVQGDSSAPRRCGGSVALGQVGESFGALILLAMGRGGMRFGKLLLVTKLYVMKDTSSELRE